VKITKLETIYVKPRWLFLKMHTDEGLVGLGEPICEGHAQAVAAAVHEMGRYLIGQDPRRIEHHWQAIYRGGFYRNGPILCSALSGIEQAMWDVTGKWLGQPVHRLLGGAVRDRVRMYGWVNAETYGDYIERGRKRVDEGFTALKMGVGGPIKTVDNLETLERLVEQFAGVRSAVGKKVDVGIDFHGRVSPAMAVRLAKALEPYYPMFIEEPCLPENVDTMVTIARSTTIPIATGERLFTKWGFREVLEKQAAVIMQPDLSHCGGILEAKKIAALAECYYAAIAPHCPLGPIALASCLQLDACTPNFLCQEHVTTGEGYLKEPFKIVDGYIEVPTKPGLGVELDDEAIARQAHDGTWDNPLWFHGDDRSVADW
jgi:galactonate dehydratase